MLKQIDLVFGAVAQTATIRLQAIFKAMLLRRRKDSVGVFLRICPRALLTLYQMLDGKRLIELPGKEVILHKLQFTQEERDIYKMVSVLFFHWTSACIQQISGRGAISSNLQSVPSCWYSAQVSRDIINDFIIRSYVM